MMADKIFLYVGCWEEHGGAPGLGLLTLDQDTGKLEFLEMLNDRISLNCSLVKPKEGILYINNETCRPAGVNLMSGQILGFHVDPDSGQVTELFRKVTGCTNPVFMSLDPSERYMVAAHHSRDDFITEMVKGEDGRYRPMNVFEPAVVMLIEVKEDGSLGEVLDVKDHNPPEISFNAQGRGMSAHPHSATRSPSGKLYAVCDKGTGRLYMYQIDYEKKQLVLLNSVITQDEREQPRFALYHPTKPFLFVNHERSIDGKHYVCSFRYTEEGGLEKICTVNAFPEGHRAAAPGVHEQQTFQISSDGKYLYSIIHGDNCVAVFAIDQEDGQLTLIQNMPIEGDWPRASAISPNGRYLVTGCLVSGDIASYEIGTDGCLTATGSGVRVKGASSLTFFPKKQ
ncbi:MAG: lactonase family protein [Lachnospiraceae bacterium]|nr:lactonase family protein [Lachnospiraceae bacterium]